ncbi:calpain-like cysteine peptidase [Lotmaria passim]
MSTTALTKYREICKTVGITPLHQFEELLKTSVQKVDISNIYLPRKHFRCLFRLIEERPDVEELVLDGTSFTTDDIESLKECLLHSCVAKLSFRHIKLDATCATALRQLCTNNPGIVEIDLEDTCIPSAKIEEIQLIVHLNRLHADSLRSSAVVNVQNESSRVDRWRLCRERCKLSHAVEALQKPQLARTVVDEFVMSNGPLFNDPSFTAGQFNHPLADCETIRWCSYCKLDLSQVGVHNEGELGFTKSTFYNNANLCAAFNALCSYDRLTQSLLLKSLPQSGLYVLRLFIDGAVAEVVVDDTLPCLLSDGKCFLIGVSSCCHPFYGALLEKAVAKAIGGYKKIEELSFCDCIELLTGGTSFEIDLMAPAVNSTVTFNLLRSFSENRQSLIGCLIPRSEREAQACENDGIYCGLPYTILKADVCRKNGAHYAYLLQVSTPFSKMPIKYGFQHEAFKVTEVDGRLVVWMTLEDFAVLFGRVYLVMWPFEDAVSAHKTTSEFPVLSAVSTNSSLFANNSAFYIENEGNDARGVMVSLRSPGVGDASSRAKCLFYKYVEPGRGSQSRRYDICDRNALFQSDLFDNSEGSVFFNLLPREKLQLLIASQAKVALTVRFSAVESIKVAALPETMTSSRLIGEWNTLVQSRRFSDKVVCLTNRTQKCNMYCVVAIAQSPSTNPPFPIGAFGWIGGSADVVSVSAPQFSTALERSMVSVHNIFLPVNPGKSLFIIPFCCGSKCPNSFELTVFSVTGLTRTTYDTTSFL